MKYRQGGGRLLGSGGGAFNNLIGLGTGWHELRGKVLFDFVLFNISCFDAHISSLEFMAEPSAFSMHLSEPAVVEAREYCHVRALSGHQWKGCGTSLAGSFTGALHLRTSIPLSVTASGFDLHESTHKEKRLSGELCDTVANPPDPVNQLRPTHSLGQIYCRQACLAEPTQLFCNRWGRSCRSELSDCTALSHCCYANTLITKSFSRSGNISANAVISQVGMCPA